MWTTVRNLDMEVIKPTSWCADMIQTQTYHSFTSIEQLLIWMGSIKYCPCLKFRHCMGKWDGPLLQSNKGRFTKKPDTYSQYVMHQILEDSRTEADGLTAVLRRRGWLAEKWSWLYWNLVTSALVQNECHHHHQTSKGDENDRQLTEGQSPWRVKPFWQPARGTVGLTAETEPPLC